MSDTTHPVDDEATRRRSFDDGEPDPALADPDAPTTGDPMWQLDQDPDEYDEDEQPSIDE